MFVVFFVSYHLYTTMCLTPVKVKVKVTLEQATKAQSWNKGIALLFL